MGKKIFTAIPLAITVMLFAVLANASGQSFYLKDSNTDITVESSESFTDETDMPTTEITTTMTEDATTEESTEETTEQIEEQTEEQTEELTTEAAEPWVAINPDGKTLLTRFNPPKGYTRKELPEGSFESFVCNYPLKEHGAPVKLYNGALWDVQYIHAAIFDLPLENEDFQQCADSIMRMYAEYYWHTGQQEKIAFYCTTGFLAEYTMWRDGYRFNISGNNISWVKTDKFNDSYYNYTKYMRMVFAYAGTLSMDRYESIPISMDDLQIGDVWLEGDSPGHVIMVADICYDENGKKAFLLADGHTPAMDFHIMKNYLHKDDPWFYEDEITYPFVIFVHTYMSEANLQRLTYLK